MPRTDDGKLRWPQDFINQVICGDALSVLRQMPPAAIECVVTSPPYWGIRSYPGTERWWDGDSRCPHRPGPDGCRQCGAWYGQLGLELTWQLYLQHLQTIFREVQRVLVPHGSLWLNLGDMFLRSGGNSGPRNGEPRCRDTNRISRAGSTRFADRSPQSSGPFRAKHKLGLPWRVRFALNEDGWISRADVVWHKPNALPSSVKDRLGTRHELLFHFVKQPHYFFDLDAIRIPHRLDTPKARRDLERMMAGRKVYQGKWAHEPGVQRAFVGGHPAGKNPGDVWTIPPRRFRGAHFATFPDALCVRPILATCPEEVCRACGETQVPVREIPVSYGDLRSVSWPDRRVIGYKGCGCATGFARGVVLDPFAGSGTTLAVARALGRRFIGIDVNRGYCLMAETRLERERASGTPPSKLAPT